MTIEAPAHSSDQLLDELGRPLNSLRVSVIDRCDLRCAYCMPEPEYTWLPSSDILSFDEISALVGIFARLGVTRVRITGGEPLLRADLDQLVGRLRQIPNIREIALTTNGTQLRRWADRLRAAGLDRITVSLDSLRPERFAQLTRRDDLPKVLEGIERTGAAGFSGLKINVVVMRGFNDDELVELVEFAERVGAEIRFIEYMDVGGATRWSADQVVSSAEIVEHIEKRCGPVRVQGSQGHAPAQRFELPSGQRFGVIASVTEPFCSACDRSRLTADGLWYLCLYAQDGIDLRSALRDGASDSVVADLIRTAWSQRQDRGAELRRSTSARGALYQIDQLQQNPHREMHTRGG
jgi:cyclic pyranopterin phosphate synthase